MTFCGKCGAQNQDGATFCEACGAPLTGGAGAAPGGNGSKKLSSKTIGIIAVAAAAVLVLVILFAALGGRSDKAVVKQLINAVNTGKGKSIVALIPDKVIKESDMTKKEMTEELDDSLEYIRDGLDDQYDKWKITYKITDTENITGKDLKRLKENYDDEYDVKVKAAKELEVKMTLKGDDETDTEKSTITVIKVGGSWYLDVGSMYSIF